MREEREFWNPSIEGVPKSSRLLPRLYGGNIREKFPKVPASSRSAMVISSRNARFQHLIKNLMPKIGVLGGNFWKFPLCRNRAGNSTEIRSNLYNFGGANGSK